jgi:hypothetical protein
MSYVDYVHRPLQAHLLAQALGRLEAHLGTQRLVGIAVHGLRRLD